ncbi:hypothetical protein [Paenibacillus sp. FSL H7-0331]|nr:hypothetical protein BK127_24520 [Paenibacillus sp. FSL H7-0331]
MNRKVTRIYFLCYQNRCRSQMAEGFLERLATKFGKK